MMGYVKREGKYLDIDYDREFFPTPPELCREVLMKFPATYTAQYALDPGAGTGNWGKEFKKLNKSCILDGIEVDGRLPKPKGYDNWLNKNYLLTNMGKNYDIIFGNPPFSKAEEFIIKGISELYEHGYLIFLLRLAFLESKGRQDRLYSVYPPKIVYTLTKRPSFGGDGKTGMMAYTVIAWQEGYTGDTKLDWLYW